MNAFDIKIVDLGNACWTYKHFASDIQTRQYRCPEVIVGAKVDLHQLISGPSNMLDFELATGDLLFDPRASETDDYDRDEDHLAQMYELLGKIQKKVALSGKYSKKFLQQERRTKAYNRFASMESEERTIGKVSLQRVRCSRIF